VDFGKPNARCGPRLDRRSRRRRHLRTTRSRTFSRAAEIVPNVLAGLLPLLSRGDIADAGDPSDRNGWRVVTAVWQQPGEEFEATRLPLPKVHGASLAQVARRGPYSAGGDWLC